jgi:hypothetical protein
MAKLVEMTATIGQYAALSTAYHTPLTGTEVLHWDKKSSRTLLKSCK